MSVVPFNTLEMARKLEKAKFDRTQAESLTEIIADAMQSSEIATKSDLEELRRELKSEIGSVRADMKDMEAGIRADMKDMEGDIKELQGQNKIVIGIVIANFVATMAMLAKGLIH